MVTLDSLSGRAETVRALTTVRRALDSRLAWRVRAGALFAVPLLILTAAVGCASSTDDTAAPAGSPGKYDQTWTKAYDATTCSEWNDEMSDRQQWVAAADMLTGARNKGDGGTGLPADALVEDFQADITESCSADAAETMKIAEVGASVYLIGRTTYEP